MDALRNAFPDLVVDMIVDYLDFDTKRVGLGLKPGKIPEQVISDLQAILPLRTTKMIFAGIIAEFYGKREGWWDSCTGKLFRENIERLKKEHRAWFNAKYSFEQSLPLSMRYGYVKDPLAELKTRLKTKRSPCLEYLPP